MIRSKINWPLKQKLIVPLLQGERIFLQAPKLSDYKLWQQVRRSNRDWLVPFEPQWAPNILSIESYKRRLKNQAREVKAGRGLFFFIFQKDTERLIGGLNLNDIHYGAARHGSMGYWLDEKYTGQGYMQEAARLLIKYSFQDLKLARLNAATLPHNKPSINLLKALNFQEEGFATKYLQINGRWQDHRLFGLTNPNFS